MPYIEVQGNRIEYERLSPNNGLGKKPVIVLLHEGLGSISMWRDFPQKVADFTSHEVMVYSRYGYGNSEASPGFALNYMHEQGQLDLPELLSKLNIEKPILLGHSDGASIALIAAGGTNLKPQGVIVMAPHVMIEPIALESIEQAKIAYLETDLKNRLSRYHANVDSAFWGWNNAWLSSAFKHWNIENFLPQIDCPILGIQGYEDEYGTMAQLDRIAELSKNSPVELLKLENCKHSPHKDQPEKVLQAIHNFIKKLNT